MAKKLQHHQRKRLQAQGRCFKCQKKGHRASECTHKPAATLAELPVEILNLIFEHLLFPWAERFSPHVFAVLYLRLTCRKINAKTLDLLAFHAFGRTSVNNNFNSFQRLVNISKTPLFASKIRALVFHHYESIDATRYEDLEKELARDDERLDQEQRRSHTARMRQADQESNNMAFFEGSAQDGIMLAGAMSRLSNVDDIYISPPQMIPVGRRALRCKYGSQLPSVTHTFSMLLACLKSANIRPHQLRCILGGGRGLGDDAIDLQALAVPNVVLHQLHDLTYLELNLRCNSSSHKNASTWPSHLAGFLKQVPLLTRLEVGLDDDFADTSAIFDHVAGKIQLSHLKHLKFNGLECNGGSLQTFMRNHAQLDHLELWNINIVGDATFRKVLEVIENELGSLTSVDLYQISQESLRMVFKTLGNLGAIERYVLPDEEPDFFADFLHVDVYRHHATIEAWEGVSSKLGKLRGDVETIDRTYHARRRIEAYGWDDR